MTDSPWLGDTCSLVEAFRSGERSPVEELEATIAAIEASELNAFSHRAYDEARAQARSADVAKPLGGVPIGVKELQRVAGWPNTKASVPLADQRSEVDCVLVARLREAGAVLVGMTTASEFGGVNLTRTRLNGITRNPWNLDRTPGGSSGGAAAAVAGGLVTMSTAGDGGGSTRIPAGFVGMFGLKEQYGRIPHAPFGDLSNLTGVSGAITRSVRDTARFLDITNGFDPRDPYSQQRVDGYERNLGAASLAGLRVAVAPDLGGAAVVRGEIMEMIEAHAALMIADAGLARADIAVRVPESSLEWALSGLGTIRKNLGDLWPDCAGQLTPQIRFGLEMAERLYGLDIQAKVEAQRTRNTELMASLFDEVDLVICATNPDVAFAASGPLPTVVDQREAGPGNNGALTIPANLFGNPSVSIPIGTLDGLPVGMQVMARHHREDLLLSLAALVERERPWPLVAPGAPL